MSTSEISEKERHSRGEDLEENYVRHIYEKIAKDLTDTKSPLEVTVNEFLDDLEPGSLVADIGCGDGRHLEYRNSLFSLGIDSSSLQVSLTKQRCREAILGDNLRLPLRGNAFDAVLSVDVIHHFTTTRRRIKALEELARILRIGGKILIAVQGQNPQKSQDVLIPWIGVQESRRLKTKYLLNQDSDEYDTDEDDTISLPSSDEEDIPLSIYAKFHPSSSQLNANDGRIFDRQTFSLDYNCQLPSNYVPNPKKRVQTPLHYDFIRKALMRFSSAKSSPDGSLDSELRHAGDLDAPSTAPACEKEQIFFFSLDRTDLAESTKKTIQDNFIELLNIDDERNCSCFLEEGISFNTKNTKRDFALQDNNNFIIESLSGVFKNMNSMWSTKQTKSCSDLKSQSYCGTNRLVRSKTTATFNTGFPASLEGGVVECDMTLGEANEIVDGFLEASLQTAKLRTYDEKRHFRTSLICSDIASLPTHTTAHSMSVGKALPTQSKLNEDIDNSQGILQKERKECSDGVKENLKSKFNSIREQNSETLQRYLNCTCNVDKSESSNVFKNATRQNKVAVANTNKNVSKVGEKGSAYRCKEETFVRRDFLTSLNNEDIDSASSKCEECGFFNKMNFQTEHNIFNTFDKSHFSKTSQNLNIRKEIENNNSVILRNPCSASEETNNQICFHLGDDKNLLHSTSKKMKNVSKNCIYKSNSKLLGPFYDEDYYGSGTYTSLASYYSMPELHALSDFYAEYNIVLVGSIESSCKYDLKPSILNHAYKNDLQLSQTSCIIAKDNITNLGFNCCTSKNQIDRYIYDKDIKTALSDPEVVVVPILGKKKLCDATQYSNTNISNKENCKHFSPLFANTRLNQNIAKDFSFAENIDLFLLNSRTNIDSQWENNILDSNLSDNVLQKISSSIIKTEDDKVDFKHARVNTSSENGSNNSSNNIIPYNRQLESNLQMIDSGKLNKAPSKDGRDNGQRKDSVSKNISNVEPPCSHLKQTNLVYSNRDIQNGANINLYPPMQPTNILSCVFTNTFQTQVVDAMSSEALPTNCTEGLIDDENKLTKTSSTETSFKKVVDYMYGYINVERPFVVSHRYYHLFQKEELHELIENNIKDLHVLRSFQHESHCCVIAEKVRVWTI